MPVACLRIFYAMDLIIFHTIYLLSQSKYENYYRQINET